MQRFFLHMLSLSLGFILACNKPSIEENDLVEVSLENELITMGSFIAYVEDGNVNMDEAISKYFLEPELMLLDSNAHSTKKAHYIRFLFFARALENNWNLKYLWNSQIYDTKFAWMIDRRYCENILVITESIEDPEKDKSFCTCFRESKIYSVYPFQQGDSVFWARSLSIGPP
ncbi:MAG: hypothetical protein ABJG68_17235 [Crocinitomicaceae bacterium]